MFAIIAVLTGWFQSFFIFSTLIFIHELGHFLTAMFLGWKVDKITFYPYGGSSSFSEDINRPLKEELLILIMGPLIQMVFFFLLQHASLSMKTQNLLETYHFSILLFNLLPIYPLDGGKLMQICFSYYFPYKKSIYITLQISFILLFGLMLLFLPHRISGNVICLFILLLTKLIGETKKRDYYYQKFLLERYLNQYHFSKMKVIDNTKEMMRDKKHLFHINDRYYSEKEILRKKYQKR